ncbi:metallophosphoesterase family protein [Paenibacillus sp. DMB20]|uniref:metallophosphoesterase family protein n=1 Tax=Paenibacillus sp. DMB20 TaxID=1642570 RepID=UPI000628116A|nr:DNA repair exonuclease [Paenibacillus sp. DMB20]KKO52777.1 metallophosphoesterase [Paenibacillus sp. DMB20]
MLPFRFIHAADLHLDSPFTGMSGISDLLRKHLRQSTFAALERMVGLAVSERVDFIVISGDVYDSAQTSLRAQLRLAEALETLHREGIGVYLIHGNHDPLDSPRLAVTLPPNVHVFGSEPESVTARRRDGREAAVISGMSYPTAKVTENIALGYPANRDNPELFHIAMLHANVDGDQAHETYAPCTKRDLISKGCDYWALGHIHSRRILNESPYIVYPGNIQGRNIRETGPKGCYLVSVNENGKAALTFHELDTVRWFRMEAPIDGFDQVEAWRLELDRLVAELSATHHSRLSIVRIAVTGRGPLHRQLEDGFILDDLKSELRRSAESKAATGGFGGCVWIESFVPEFGAEVDWERLRTEDSFNGELLRLAEAELEGHMESELVSHALRPLLDQAEIRSLLSAVTPDEQREWLRRAVELTTLLLQEQGGGGETA